MPRSYHLQCNTVDSVREDFCNKGYSISSGWFYSVAFFFLVLCCSVTPGLLQASLFYPDLLSSALFGLISDGRDADTIAFQNVCDTSELRQKFLKKRCAFFFFLSSLGYFYLLDLNQAPQSTLPQLFLKVGEPLWIRCKAIHVNHGFGLTWELEDKALEEVTAPTRGVYRKLSAWAGNPEYRLPFH